MKEQQLRKVIREELKRVNEDMQQYSDVTVEFVPAVGLVIKTPNQTIEVHAWWEDLEEAVKKARETRSSTTVQAQELTIKN